MTAREDQPQLGTCVRIDHENKHLGGMPHLRSDCCTNWTPIAPEDQPRPTPPYKIGEGQFGTVSSGMLRYLDMQKEASEAQGEAPQFGTCGRLSGGLVPHAITESCRGWKASPPCPKCGLLPPKEYCDCGNPVRVETGAHPSQDAPQLEMLPEGEHTAHGHPHSYSICSEGGDGHKCIALAFGETDEEAASRARQIIAGYYGGARSTPSPDPPPCLKCGDTLATVQHGNKQGLICMSCRDGELSRCLRIDHMHTPEQGCWELRPTSERLSERAALAPSLPTKGEK